MLKERSLEIPGKQPRTASVSGVPSMRSFTSRFLGSGPATVSLMLLVLIALISALAPLLTPYGRDEIDLENIAAPPSAEHVLGTDELGRDLFARLLYGGRFTLVVAFASMMLAAAAGVLLGSAAGFFGGAVDRLVSALVDLFLSVPVFLVLLVAASASIGRIWIIPVVIAGTSWMETARLVRARFMQLREEGFVEAARSLGAGSGKIIFRHMLPQAMAQVAVAGAVGFANAMLVESSLSFLGFGVQPPIATWGNMLHNGRILLRTAPVSAFAPGFLIFIVCLCANYVGAGLKQALAREGR